MYPWKNRKIRDCESERFRAKANIMSLVEAFKTHSAFWLRDYKHGGLNSDSHWEIGN